MNTCLPCLTYEQLENLSKSSQSTQNIFTNASIQNTDIIRDQISLDINQDSLFRGNGQDIKRSRENEIVVQKKKGKGSFGPITKLATDLFDSDTGTILGFRCFRDYEIYGNQESIHEIIKNDKDDDCESDSDEIKLGTEFLMNELENTVFLKIS